MEEVEDPTLTFLLRDKRSELDRMITMLADRDTPRFLHGSMALYGGVDASCSLRRRSSWDPARHRRMSSGSPPRTSPTERKSNSTATGSVGGISLRR